MINWAEINMFEIIIWFGVVFVLFPAWIYILAQLYAGGMEMGRYKAIVQIRNIHNKGEKDYGKKT